MVQSLPDYYLPPTPPAPYVPPSVSLSRPTAAAINRATDREASITLPGFDRVIPVIFGEARTQGLWLVRPYVASSRLRFAILWSWGEIEGVQAVYLNGQAVSGAHMTHYAGTQTQAVDSTLAGDIAGFADAYKGLGYTVFDLPAATYTGVPETMQVEAVVRGVKVNNPAGGGGGTQPASARHWRILVTASHSTDSVFATFSEIQFRATIGGPDQTTSGVASASSQSLISPPYQAFDGNNSTAWLSASGAGSPQWIAYDFGADVDVTEVYLRPGGSAQFAARGPVDFAVQYSGDGFSWTTLEAFNDEPAWSAGESRTYAVSEVPIPETMWTQNPARCAAHWAQSAEFGPGDTVTGLEACAARCDELVGGVEVRCEVGLVLDQPMPREAMWDLWAAYGEFLWADDGGQVVMVPDAPVADIDATVDRSDIVGGTLRLTGDGLTSAPTEVTVAYREPSGGAAQWEDRSETVQLAGVDTGIVAAVRSDLSMPGIQRSSEAGRKALLRLRRLQHTGKYAWQAYDDGIRYQRGDVVQLPDTRGMIGRQVRILSVEQVALGIYQITAEAYDASIYPDDYVPGNTTTVPVGGILPYIGAGVPAGYDLFTAADGRMLVGAGGLWSRGDVFGDTAFTVAGSTSVQPNHSYLPNFSDLFLTQDNRQGPGSGLYRDVTEPAGSHSHPYSVAQDRTPQFAQTRLIIKTGAPGGVPVDAGVWADGQLIAGAYSALSVGLGRLARAGGSVTNGGTQFSYSLPVSLTAAGAHTHAANLFSYSSGIDFPVRHWDVSGASRGAHTHALTVSVKLSIPRIRLAHFVASITTNIVPGAIIGFDSDAALPPGWEEAGTIDFWIERSAVGDAGSTVAGTRQAVWSGTTEAGGQHNHKGLERVNDYVYTRSASHDDGYAHTHTVSGAVPYDPPSYAMRFIQYTGAV